MTAFQHTTVLRSESVDALAPRDGGIYVDCTLGGGGHAAELLDRADCTVIGLDRDLDAIEAARTALSGYGERFRAVHTPFSALAETLAALDIPLVDGILADLGVSSHQIDTDERGFSFRREGPVDMRMDRTDGHGADVLVNKAGEAELTRIIREFGEERFAGRIASTIVKGRPWASTTVLAEAIRECVPGNARNGRIHPATRTFQALRIVVNDELGELEQLLEASLSHLAPGGRLAIISFHSLEDRIVKRFMALHAGKNSPRDPWGHPIGSVLLSLLPPITPSDEEVAGTRAGDASPPRTANPRARSARLRVAERLPWNAP